MANQDELVAQQNLNAAHAANRNNPDRILSRLRAALPTMHDGGVVKETGPVVLQKGEQVVPADQTEPNGQDDTAAVSGEPIKLQQALSKLQESLTKLADGLGVRRSATVNYIHGESMDSHTAAVGQALDQAGGLAANLLTSHHHAGGRGWGSGDGSTQAYPAQKLQTTIIPNNNEDAKAAISACRSFVNKVESLIGEDQSVTVAKSQIKLIGKHDGSGMTLQDLMMALTHIVGPPIQAVARAYSGVHQDKHAPHLRALGPQNAAPQQEPQQETQQGQG
jgi:hypothetical protein